MAKSSAVQRNEKRKRMNEKFSEKRAELKAIVMDRSRSAEERMKAQFKLSELPRNSAKVRIRNRCGLTGRPRGYYRKLNLSRIGLRDLASNGKLPGMVKSSW